MKIPYIRMQLEKCLWEIYSYKRKQKTQETSQNNNPVCYIKALDKGKQIKPKARRIKRNRYWNINQRLGGKNKEEKQIWF